MATAVDRELTAGGGPRPTPVATVALLILVDYLDDARLRGFMRLAFARWGMAGTPGLRFAKFLGSGRDGRFGIWPSLSHQGIMLAFDTTAALDAFQADSKLLSAIRRDGRHVLEARLRAYSTRGTWSRRMPFPATAARPPSGPVASLTRASIRPSKAVEFWRHAPASQTALAAADGCLLSVGLGEAPVLRQATFTVWKNEAAMDAYARSGAHLVAIRAARAGRHFNEDMFTRFVVDHIRGDWPGYAKGALSSLGA